jgi:hypothetical protein
MVTKLIILITYSLLLSFTSQSLTFLDDNNCFNPETGVYKSQPEWVLGKAGEGEINFTGTGNSIHLRLTDKLDINDYSYLIHIAGIHNGHNGITTVSRGDGTPVCTILQSLNKEMAYNYRISVEPKNSRIRLFLNNQETWTCVDFFGWKAKEAKYFAIAAGHAHFEICDLKANPLALNDICQSLSPHETRWLHLVPTNRVNVFSFEGFGREPVLLFSSYIGLSGYRYKAVLSGSENTMTQIFRNDLKVCETPHTINEDKVHKYEFRFDKIKSLITVFVDDSIILNCKDNSWIGGDVEYLGIQRSTNTFFQICDVRQTDIQSEEYSTINNFE